MRKVYDEGEKIGEKGGEKKIMPKILDTNIVASQPPKLQLTGTLSPREKCFQGMYNNFKDSLPLL